MIDRIKVLDSPMGTGKTTSMINYINSLSEDKKIIYITPFLEECDRIILHCENKKFVQPDKNQGGGRKMDHLITLIQQGENIVSTHALFTRIDDDLIMALRSHDYILVLDETMNVVERFSLYSSKDDNINDKKTKDDLDTLRSNNLISISEDYTVKWNNPDSVLGKYETLIRLANRNLIYLIRDSILAWTFPIEIFLPGIFSEIYILTYKFDYQMQSYYYKYFGLEYKKYHIENVDGVYTLKETIDENYDFEWKQKAKENIEIVNIPSMNSIGSMFPESKDPLLDFTLSKSWYDNNRKHNKKNIDLVKTKLSNFFSNTAKTKSAENMWTCYKEHKPLFRDKYIVSKNWIELTSRATNKYIGRRALGYMINRFPNPFFEAFFSIRDIHINASQLAVSDMIQWIWRSSVRDDQKIVLYIPSIRMRTLLEKFLNNEEIL